MSINIEDEKKDFYYASTRPDLIPFIPNDAKTILDAGCGAGELASFLKKRNNAEVWGIEYNEKSGLTAREQLDHVLIGDVMKRIDEVPDGYFDLIMFNDVLEHLIDPYSTLALARKKLSKEGNLFASIPHIRYFKVLLEILVKKDFKYVDDGVMDRTHLRFFTKKSIERMFQEQGFKIVDLRGLNPSKSIRPYVMSALTLGLLSDSKYLQYLVIAQAK
jgi:2-polyprenyl-3-methyl-5-hydroxy-6-metoxy-1,4-benzoquinol methylase